MIKAGTENTEISSQYISDVQCKNCQRETEHLLLVYCKTFVFGLWFWPVKWWSWNKNAKMKCNECKTVTTVDKNNYGLPPKILNYYNKTGVPFIYKLPTLLGVFSILTLCILLALGVFATLIFALQPIESKLVGVWKSTDNTMQMHIYKDKNVTVISNDTIVFSNYDKDGSSLNFNFLGKQNSFSKNNLNPMVVSDLKDEEYSFIKTEATANDDYRREKNTWRIKSSRPESNEQIRQRILGYFNFEKNKFQEAINQGVDLVDNDVYAPVVFAVNGIGIRSNSIDNWKPIFYDENDWNKANLILQNEFPNEFMLDESEKNLFKRNLDIVNFYIKKIQNSKLDYLSN